MASDSTLNNNSLYGFDSLTQKIMETAKDASVELKGTLNIVSGILDKSGKLDDVQKSIIAKLRDQQKYTEKLQEIEKETTDKKERQQKIDELNAKTAQEAVSILKKRQEALIEYSTLEEKLASQEIFYENQKNKLTSERNNLQKELIEKRNKLAEIEAAGNKDEVEGVRKELQRKEAELRQKNQEISQAKQDLQRTKEDKWVAENKSPAEAQSILSAREHNRRLEDLRSQVREKEKERKSLRGLDDDASKKAYRELTKEIKDLSGKISELGDEIDENDQSPSGFAIGGKSIAELGGFSGALKEALGFGSGASLKGILEKAISAFVSSAAKAFDQSVEKAVSIYNDYALKTNFRMEALMSGNQKYFDDMVGQVRGLLSYNGSMRQEDLIRQISAAVDQGIAYNVEQRAFLQTVSDNIQSTFDAFNSNLTRIIRIQQADSTIQRLGMEKALNDMLTDYFKDSSYLQNTYDAVSDALFEATATQTREQAVETEFVIQKWLGSLYSLGASNNVINQIATGLGYLGSGNVNALAGNAPLQNLLAISASRAGEDYAELLTQGLDPERTNKLMQAMVEYLAEIADSTSNNRVVTSAFGNVFGMSVSDIKSFQNLVSSISDIASETLNYSQAGGYTQNALNSYLGYMSMSQMYSNFFENAKLGAGFTFANGPGYLLYKATDLIQSLSGGGHDTQIAPFGTGIKFNLFDMIKTGMFGIGLIGNLVSGLTSNVGLNALNLNNWRYEDVVSRGTGFNLRNTQGTSFSTTVGNASSKDIESQTLKEGAQKKDQITNEVGGNKAEDWVKGIYEGLVNPGDRAVLTEVRGVLLESKKIQEDTREYTQSIHNYIPSIISLIDQVGGKVDTQTDLINYKAEITNQLLEQSYDILRQVSMESTKRSLNVNIQKVSGVEVRDGLIKTTPDDRWMDLVKGAAILIKYGQTFGELFDDKFIRRIINDDANSNKYTLQDLLDLMIPLLESEYGLPVRLESTDSMTNLLADLTRR